MAKKTRSRYELKEKLGEGGMGVVWSAYDNVLNADVALKTLLDVADAEALKLFYEECNRQAALVHPNVIEIRDVGAFEENGIRQPYLVMPLLRGKTLADLIRASRQSLTVERCVDIFTQASRGLHASHDHGLLHRDIKPSNIFILDDDSVKIIDFGIAHRLDANFTGGKKGTLLYMSPEQILLKPLGRSSDVFALGVVCYEALTGKQPFARASETAIVEAIQQWNPPPASSVNSDVSVAVSQVLRKAMAKSPGFRFSTAKEFGDALRKAFYDSTYSVFEASKFAPRVLKASQAFDHGDLGLALEIVDELEVEGYFSADLQRLSTNVRAAVQKRDVERLLESARTRVQDKEYRLALQRVHEALQLDERNPEALALRDEIESRRAEADILEWLDVGQQHLERFNFSHAKQAAQRILDQHPNEERAFQFLTQVERKKNEYQQIQEEKQEAYAAALEAQRQNDLTSALSRMKRVLELERQAPDVQEPGRRASLESFYHNLHAEHEAIADKYREAKQAFDRGNYAAVAALCDQLLEKYPQHTLFKALKYDNDQRWRRAISSQIIQVEEEADNEPDLDRRVSFLERVVQENPQISEFQNLLQEAQDKRNLVAEIVKRARELADRERFGEAIAQWETLQTIHPDYPGLAFEIDNMCQRRALADRVALKKQWVNQIHREWEQSRFEEALRIVSLALEDFPADGELLEIEKSIRQEQESALETEDLIRRGRKDVEAGDISNGLQKLREAHEIGAKIPSAKTALIDGLFRAARASQDDRQTSSNYLREILHLEPGNQTAQGMSRLLDDQAEQDNIDASIFRARQLQSTTNFVPAIKLLQEAIEKYPANTRLRAVLQEIEQSQQEARNHDLEVIRRKRMEADQTLNGSTVYRQIDEAKKLANRYEDDAEVQEETRLWQTRLQSVASENRTSISREATRVYQPSGPVQLAGPRMRRRWLPLALGASLAVAASTFFVGKTVLQTRQHQAEMKPARDLHAAVVKPKTSAGEKSVAPAEATSEPQAPKPAESETQTKGAAPLGIPTNPPEPPPAETSSPKTAISESPNASPVPSAVPMVKKPTGGSLIVHANQSGTSIALLRGDKVYRSSVIARERLTLADIPAGQYKLHAHKDGFQAPADKSVNIENAGTLRIDIQMQQLVAVNLHTLPDAEILIDEKPLGKTDAEGRLKIDQIAVGGHHIEARRRGKSSAEDVQISAINAKNTLEVPLEAGPGSVALALLPASAVVTVSQPDGKIVPVSGTRFDLPAGRYEITARAADFNERTQTVDVAAEQTSNVNLTLVPKKQVAQPVQTLSLDGWDRNLWDFDDDHTAISHKKNGVSLYYSLRGRGIYLFTVGQNKWDPHDKKQHIQWVAGYLDRNNYLLFSIENGVFESFLVQNGHKLKHGDPLSLPESNQYQVRVEVQSDRVVTSLNNGRGWQTLQDWTQILENLDRGQFGFKDQVTLYSFQFTSRSQ